MAVCLSLTESLRARMLYGTQHTHLWSRYSVLALASRITSVLCSYIRSVARESDIEDIRLAFLSNCHVTRLERLEREIRSSNKQGTPISRRVLTYVCACSTPRNIPLGHARFSS